MRMAQQSARRVARSARVALAVRRERRVVVRSQVRDVTAVDPEVARILAQEDDRQRYTLAMIASENYASLAVRQAQASVLTNKYSEGYPGRRYYQGNAFVDDVES